MASSSSSTTARQSSRFCGDPSEVIIQNDGDFKLIVDLLRSVSNKCCKEWLDGLEEEKGNCQYLRDAWNRAEQIYSDNTHVPEFAEDDARTYYQVAIITYVIESPFYQEFNRLTRELKTKEDVEGFKYKHYFSILRLAVLRCKGHPMDWYEEAQAQDWKYVRVYRGVRGRVNVKRGDYICFQHFLSTSKNRGVALQFAGRTGTVFEIDLLMKSAKVPNWVYANAVCLDHIPKLVGLVDEDECLVGPLMSYRVRNVIRPVADGVEFVCLESCQYLFLGW